MHWVQEVAREHWDLLASDELKEQFFWVMVSHFIEYKGEALLGETVTLKTYVLHSQGVFSTRVVEMFLNTSKKMIVRSETKWCLIHTKTKKPIRIPESIFTIFHG